MALRESDPEETLYSGLMEGLGYSANRKPFLELARAVPVATLRALRAEPSATRSLAMTAILLNAASLLAYAGSLCSAPGFEGLLTRLPRTARVPRSGWHLSRMRPANPPGETDRRSGQRPRPVSRVGASPWPRGRAQKGGRAAGRRTDSATPHRRRPRERAGRECRAALHARLGRDEGRRGAARSLPPRVPLVPDA